MRNFLLLCVSLGVALLQQGCEKKKKEEKEENEEKKETPAFVTTKVAVDSASSKQTGTPASSDRSFLVTKTGVGHGVDQSNRATDLLKTLTNSAATR